MDSRIILAAQKGDTAAFEHIYKNTYREAYAVAFGILHDKGDAEDALQEAYITLMQKIPTLTDCDKFDSWFKRIVNNRCIDFMRKKKPAYFSSLFDDENDEQAFENSELFLDQTQNTENIVMDNAERDIISNIINSLPDDQRICIISFYYQDLSIKEIAENLNVSEATVKSRLKYGKDKINKAILEEEKKSGIKLHGIFALPLSSLLGKKSVDIPAFDTVKSKCAAQFASKAATYASGKVAEKVVGAAAKKIISIIVAAVVLTSAAVASFTVPVNNGFTIAETVLGKSSFGISKDETVGLKTLLAVYYSAGFREVTNENIGENVLLWFYYYGKGTAESNRFDIQYILRIPSTESVEGLCYAFNVENINSISITNMLAMYLANPLIALADAFDVELPEKAPDIKIRDIVWNGDIGKVTYEAEGTEYGADIRKNKKSLFGISLITDSNN